MESKLKTIRLNKKKQAARRILLPVLVTSLLHRQQLAVYSIFCFEFGVRAFLHKLSFLHHDNLVGIADGLQMVGNDQDRAVSDKRGHCLLYFVLIDGIDIARYLV